MYIITKNVSKVWSRMNYKFEKIEANHPTWKFGFVGAFNKSIT